MRDIERKIYHSLTLETTYVTRSRDHRESSHRDCSSIIRCQYPRRNVQTKSPAPEQDPGTAGAKPYRTFRGCKYKSQTDSISDRSDTDTSGQARPKLELNKIQEPQEPNHTAPSEDASTSHRQTRSQTDRIPRPPVKLDPSWD